MYDDAINSHRFPAQDLLQIPQHSSDSGMLQYMIKPIQMEEEREGQLNTSPQISQIAHPCTPVTDMANPVDAAQYSFPTWLLSTSFELTIALLLWIAAMASFIAAKFIRIVGLHPPYFFPRSTSNWLGHQGSLLCDHVSEELSMLSQSILHRDYKANTTQFTSFFSPQPFGQDIPHSSPLHWVKPASTRLGVPTTLHDNGCPCFENSPLMDGLNTSTFNETPRMKSRVHHKTCAGSHYCVSCSSSLSRRLFREEFTKKQSYDTLSNPSDSCEVSSDNSNANVSQSDYEQSLEVFPEEITDFSPSIDEESTSEGQVLGFKMQSKIQYDPMVSDMVTDPDVLLHEADSKHHNTKGHFQEALMSDTEALDQVYLELEKERTASATAADEAMAMIAKLQQDKAALQMEAVQYQRMAEERTQCDEEAISVLRDLLVRQEEERALLEREVGHYRAKLLDQEDNDPRKEAVVDNALARPSAPKDLEDFAALHELELTKNNDTLQNQQLNQLDMVRGLQSNQSKRATAMEMKLGSAATDGCWQHVILGRIFKLEEQIHLLRGKSVDCSVVSGVLGANLDRSTSQAQRLTCDGL